MQKPLTSSVALGSGCPVTGQSEAMSDRKASLPERIAGFLFGAVAYLVFGGTFLYAIGFVAGMVVPKDIDGGTVVPALEALMINVWLMSLFAVQHSVMARKPFKRWWTQLVPHTIERSVYVLFSSLVLILLFWQWRPMPAIVWQVADPTAATALMALSFAGWLLVLTSTFLINHFELFGLHQVITNLAGRKTARAAFQDAAVLQGRAPPALSRLHRGVLGDAGHDGRPSVVRRRHHRLHLRRHLPGGARPRRPVRGAVQALPRAGGNDHSVPAQSVLILGKIVGGAGDASPAPFCCGRPLRFSPPRRLFGPPADRKALRSIPDPITVC